MTQRNKHILIGITGSIAAYKSATLVSQLKKQGAKVRVVMTKHAQQFITPVTLETLSGNPVRTHLFESDAHATIEHIELARWADLIVIAPASANFIARLAHGLADDLLSTLCLASTAPLFIAPAMNQFMWHKPVTQENIASLHHRNIQIIGPAAGIQACGDTGMGRMLTPREIIGALTQHTQTSPLTKKRILITAGPTHEPIDPIRFLGNKSSGKMGFALAQAATNMGATVTLISGPVSLPTPTVAQYIPVVTADDMHQAVMQHINQQDIFIGAAAVSDYKPQTVATQKIKKSKQPLSIEFFRNPDILAEVAQLKHPPITIGFAAETQDVVGQAQQKLKAKNIDMIIANQVGENLNIGTDQIAVTMCYKNGETSEIPQQSKQQVAQKLMQHIADIVVNV